MRDDSPDQRNAVPPVLRTQRFIPPGTVSATVRDRGVHKRVRRAAYLFHRLSFHDFSRDVASDAFLEHINVEDLPDAFVTPDAPTLRGLMGLKLDVAYGIDPGLARRS